MSSLPLHCKTEYKVEYLLCVLLFLSLAINVVVVLNWPKADLPISSREEAQGGRPATTPRNVPYIADSPNERVAEQINRDFQLRERPPRYARISERLFSIYPSPAVQIDGGAVLIDERYLEVLGLSEAQRSEVNSTISSAYAKLVDLQIRGSTIRETAAGDRFVEVVLPKQELKALNDQVERRLLSITTDQEVGDHLVGEVQGSGLFQSIPRLYVSLVTDSEGVELLAIMREYGSKANEITTKTTAIDAIGPDHRYSHLLEMLRSER